MSQIHLKNLLSDLVYAGRNTTWPINFLWGERGSSYRQGLVVMNVKNQPMESTEVSPTAQTGCKEICLALFDCDRQNVCQMLERDWTAHRCINHTGWCVCGPLICCRLFVSYIYNVDTHVWKSGILLLHKLRAKFQTLTLHNLSVWCFKLYTWTRIMTKYRCAAVARTVCLFPD